MSLMSDWWPLVMLDSGRTLLYHKPNARRWSRDIRPRFLLMVSLLKISLKWFGELLLEFNLIVISKECYLLHEYFHSFYVWERQLCLHLTLFAESLHGEAFVQITQDEMLLLSVHSCEVAAQSFRKNNNKRGCRCYQSNQINSLAN